MRLCGSRQPNPGLPYSGAGGPSAVRDAVHLCLGSLYRREKSGTTLPHPTALSTNPQLFVQILKTIPGRDEHHRSRQARPPSATHGPNSTATSSCTCTSTSEGAGRAGTGETAPCRSAETGAASIIRPPQDPGQESESRAGACLAYPIATRRRRHTDAWWESPTWKAPPSDRQK